MTFEEKMTKLEALAKKMESGELKLDEMIKAFEEGRTLSADCQKELEAIRLKIEKITKAGTVESLDLTKPNATKDAQ